jgi:serine/threonine protein kinase/tetratricopeptide (TPR) repeat protein
MNANDDRVEVIFHAALDCSDRAERDALIGRECKDDLVLEARVRRLLEINEDASGLLEGASHSPEAQEQFARLKPEEAGERIGPYKLLQQIGEGGFGVVWMAEQEQPVRRRVALKIIKMGMDTKEVIARFGQERQALAMMDHPNIAKVFDAGATQYGRPFFVMELVRGLKITDYCDEHQLPTAERLALFIQVCQAVQHAHQKGIIHRDLKPSNIMVTINDGVPVPKVIDFGVAKATQSQRLTDLTLFTQFEQMIGTPLYMSPEQAELTSVDIDTRSDIYSLGVLLYELLTGRTPFDQKQMLEAGLDGMRRMIREQEPVRPSTRVSTLQGEERTTTAKRHGLDAPRLVHLLRGDLDWIVMKCLEKDRGRRYATASGVASDLQRHLTNEPVSARPPSAAYRFQKFIRRNKLVFAAGSAIVVALVIGLGISTWMFLQEKEARRRAVAAEIAGDREKKKAQTEATKSQQVAQFLQDMLKGVGPEVALGRDTALLREILDQTAARLGSDLKTQPEVEAELRSTIGETYLQLARHDQAEEMLRISLDLRQKLFGPEHAAVAQSLSRLAAVLWRKGKVAEAQTMQNEALRMQRKLLGEDHRDTLESLNNLARFLFDQSRFAEAEAIHRDIMARRKRVLGEDHSDVLWSLNNLSVVLREAGKLDEAESITRDALAMQRKLAGNENPMVASLLNTLASILMLEGKALEAETIAGEALVMNRKIFGADGLNVSTSLDVLSGALQDQHKFGEAEGAQREALAIVRKLLGNDHVNVAKYLHNMADLIHVQGREAEAETFQREALGIWKKLFGPDHPDVGTALSQLCYLVSIQDRDVEAEPLARESLAIFERTAPPDHRLFFARMLLGGCLLGQKKYGEAEPLILNAYEGMKQRADTFSTSSVRLKEAAFLLVQLYEATNRPDQAAEWKKKLAEAEQAEASKKAAAPHP